MKEHIIALGLMGVLFLVSCQPAVPAAPSTQVPQAEATVTQTPAPSPTPEARKSIFNDVLTADALTAAVRTPDPTPVAYDVSVPASACWMKSSVTVSAGQRIDISASGTVNTYKGKAGSDSKPNGQPTSICGAIQCPVQGASYGALIARVEDGKPFLVGTSLEFAAGQDGQLYFTVNDWECQDNSGRFDLVITAY